MCCQATFCSGFFKFGGVLLRQGGLIPTAPGFFTILLEHRVMPLISFHCGVHACLRMHPSCMLHASGYLPIPAEPGVRMQPCAWDHLMEGSEQPNLYSPTPSVYTCIINFGLAALHSIALDGLAEVFDRHHTQ